MNKNKTKKMQGIHLILGLFLAIAGISILVDARYLFGLWILSLGLLFLFESFRESLKLKLNPKSVSAIRYVLAAIVLVTGIAALFISSEII